MKTYIRPTLSVLYIETTTILAGSDPKLGADYNGEEVLGKEQNLEGDLWED